jgi:hypothetical protein
MSEKPEKVRRQGKRAEKARFECLLTTENYDILYRLAAQAKVSMAAVINHMLRREKNSVPAE